ncbi:GD22178 [Drosophila simulans]|uniref:GD22178 n=1 Tax=Drosophila simulans TaxID=7240 RepID=B4QAD7_DROSI|nr:GD22178 [Drosophila simulans]
MCENGIKIWQAQREGVQSGAELEGGDRWSMELEMEQELEMELELEVKVTKPECQSGVPGSTHA